MAFPNGCHDSWLEWVCSRSMVQKEIGRGYKFQLRFEVSRVLLWHYVWLAELQPRLQYGPLGVVDFVERVNYLEGYDDTWL